MAARPLSVPESSPELNSSILPATQYTHEQLASIYNQARVDYIVPMPMNAKRMAEYIHYYDIDLSASFIALNDERLETGIGMLGVRGQRSWITRLGVIPERRGKHIGLYLMANLLETSFFRGIKQVQLEVIQGNEPAYQLFLKLGFQHIRELLVIRRPPGVPELDPTQEAAQVTWLDEPQIPAYLAQRHEPCSWIDESVSLLNAGSLRGIVVELPDGETGWVVFQRMAFQLMHFALSPNITPAALQAALYHIHKTFASQDTKIENLPVNSPVWQVFQAIGYFEVFRRIEMHVTLQ
ncbi:MAG: GNAT family N-acetyltransferase [Anaerolineae bacterium]|nr:GNAT family N-acetyltransferase [Anaerolineae bacterium]